MLTFDDKGGWGGQKNPKTCLRNTWMFPYLLLNLNSFFEFKRPELTVHSIFAIAHCVHTCPTWMTKHDAKRKGTILRNAPRIIENHIGDILLL
jgi:hypothetical protein